MSKQKKQAIRAAFRDSVFDRDGHRCRVCGDTKGPFDAHHITPREQMEEGGYFTSNGITLCPKCHIRAEAWLKNPNPLPSSWSKDQLYKLIR